MPEKGRKLILEAAGGFLPGERVCQLLYRLHAETGLGLPSLEKFWKGQYGSKNTESILEQTKAERAKNNADNLAATLETLAETAAMAGCHRRELEILRTAAHTIRNGGLPTGCTSDEEK